MEWITQGGTARVTSRLPVDELAALFDITIEADDVETVGRAAGPGIGRVPIAGSVGTVPGLRLTAENLAGRRNRIGTVLVERLSRADRGSHDRDRAEPSATNGQAEPTSPPSPPRPVPGEPASTA